MHDPLVKPCTLHRYPVRLWTPMNPLHLRGCPATAQWASKVWLPCPLTSIESTHVQHCPFMSHPCMSHPHIGHMMPHVGESHSYTIQSLPDTQRSPMLFSLRHPHGASQRRQASTLSKRKKNAKCQPQTPTHETYPLGFPLKCLRLKVCLHCYNRYSTKNIMVDTPRAHKAARNTTRWHKAARNTALW